MDRTVRRRLLRGLAKSALITAFVVAAYCLVPLDELAGVPVPVVLVVGLACLGTVATLEVNAILRATYPNIRAFQALATVAPLFLLLFAATYYVLDAALPGEFVGGQLSRLDAFYFTVTVFGTVGFGDISAAGDASRMTVSIQILLDLVILGAGLKRFFEAAKLARRRQGLDETPVLEVVTQQPPPPEP